MNLVYKVNDKPKFGQLIVFALQQLLAILAATIAVPSIVGNGMSQSAALFGAGVGTLVYQCFTKFKSPVFLGSSFAFLGSMFAAFAGAVTADAGYMGLLLGALFGALLKLALQNRSSSDNRLIISIALLFAFCGICTIFEISPLLGCMSMGTVYINMTDDDKLFKQLNYFSPPFLLMFFVRSGMSFDLKALVHTSGSIGSSPLILIGVLYFIIRIIGKYAGAFLGSLLVKKQKETRNYLGLALIPQAGVAIGLASLGARSLGGETGNALETIILASSVLYELIGPASAKLSLYLSKSYSTKLEDLVEVNEKTED
jgi:hypothetical protein